MTDPNLPAPAHIIEALTPLSQSRLWTLQRQYFQSRGIAAWRDGEVPQYVTTNAMVADSYAEIVLGFYRDRRRLGGADGPLVICELGAGSGRFAFHFLTSLEALCRQHAVPLDAFRYVLTDIVATNLAFLRGHPRLVRYFAQGVLDTALFDVTTGDRLTLQDSGVTVAAGALSEPLIVVANYLFDTVPQDFFHFHRGAVERGLVSLSTDAPPDTLESADLLSRITCDIAFEPIGGTAYDDEVLQAIIAEYQAEVDAAYVTFPAAALQCLSRLRTWSRAGLLLLSCDRGYTGSDRFRTTPTAGFARHGSVSLDVNYDAIRRYCDMQGGATLQPAVPHEHLSVSACLMVEGAAAYLDTKRAYQRHVAEFGPDDFFTVARRVRKHLAEMGTAELLACLRLAHYDSTQFLRYAPRLIALAPEMGDAERRTVAAAADQVWARYFSLGETDDLAFEIARVLYEIDDIQGALRYFARSIETCGDDPRTRANIATCQQLLASAGA